MDGHLNVGIIGCGKITQIRHLPEYLARPDVTVLGLTDAAPGRAEALAEQFGLRAYPSAEALLADPEIDAVSVCTANKTHCSLAVAAMRAGKHVLIEKPVAINQEEAMEMVKVSRETGRLLMPAHNQRLIPSHQKAHELLKDHRIGRTFFFESTFKHSGPDNWSITPGTGSWFFQKDAAGFGVMTDLGVHKIDLAHFLLHDPIVEVYADLTTLSKKQPDGSPVGVEDNAVLVVHMRSGAAGTITVSWNNYATEQNSTVFYGEKGNILVNIDPEYNVILDLKDGTTEKFKTGEISTNDKQLPSGVIDNFVDSLLGRAEPFADAMDGFRSIAVLDACGRSAKTHRPVEVARDIY